MDKRDRAHVGFEFKIITNMFRRIIDSFGHSNYLESVTGSNTWIIGYLFINRERDIFQKDLEREFSIRRSTASKTLQLMEEKGLIKREPVFYDARLKRLSLTEKSMEINSIIMEDFENVNKIATNGLSEEEIDTLYKITAKIKSNLIQYTKEQGGKLN